MIGIINNPTDGPTEFYAAPVARIEEPSTTKLNRPGRPMALANMGALPASFSSNSKPPPSPNTREKHRFSLGLFSHRAVKPAAATGYCADGRKCKDGRPVSTAAPSKLWDELFMRKMVNRIQQGEVASPVDHLSSIDATFSKMGLLNRQTSRSEPNLCSEDKSSAARFCDACAAAIDEELSGSVKKERALSDAALRRGAESDEAGSTTIDRSRNESVSMDDLIADLLTPPRSSAPGSTLNLCDDCSS